MSFFLKKQEVDLEVFCRSFYENVILNCVVDETNVNTKLYDTLENALIEADHNFADINLKKFVNEIISIEFELFALAWFHQFGDRSAVIQSVFTKGYLCEKKLDNIWNNMGLYSEKIACSIALGKNLNKSSDKAYMIHTDKMKMDLFGKFSEEGYDEECVGRAIGRLFTDEAWKKGITAGLILFALCDRLGFDSNFKPNEKAHSQWFIEVNNFYKMVRKCLNKVKIKK